MAPRRVNGKKAVEMMRLYLGGVDRMAVRDQHRLHQRVMREVMRLADATGMLPEQVWSEVEAVARRRGTVTPIPGHHY